MRTLVPPPAPGLSELDISGIDDHWGVRRTVRLTFPQPSALAHDPAHTTRLTLYLTDLLSPYGLALEPDALKGGQSYGEMAEALIAATVPEGEQIDLLVLVYAIPDITPGRATSTYLSHICPGTPLSFAISDQGPAAADTALRLIREYARTAGLRRSLLLQVEQSMLPYDPGVPVTVPSVSSGLAVLFGDTGAAPPQSHSREST